MYRSRFEESALTSVAASVAIATAKPGLSVVSGSSRRLALKLLSSTLLCLLLALSVVSSAGAANRDFGDDMTSFKESAVDTHKQIHDVFLPATKSALKACNAAKGIEATQGALAAGPAWFGVGVLAKINQDKVGRSSRVEQRMFTSAISDFVPWRGPGKFRTSGNEDQFNALVQKLKTKVAVGYLDGIMFLESANTLIGEYRECDMASTRIKTAERRIEWTRKNIWDVTSKISKHVKKTTH